MKSLTPLAPRNPNTPRNLARRIDSTIETYRLVADQLGIEPFVNEAFRAANRFLEQYSISGPDLDALLESLGSLSSSDAAIIHAAFRWGSKTALYAQDYLPGDVLKAVGTMYSFLSPLPPEDAQSTFGRERYPLGIHTEIWAGHYSRPTREMSFQQLTLLDRLSVVNRDARNFAGIADEDKGRFFVGIINEIAPAAIRSVRQFPGQQGQPFTVEERASYARAFGNAMQTAHDSIRHYHETGEFDIAQLVDDVKAGFFPERVHAIPQRA